MEKVSKRHGVSSDARCIMADGDARGDSLAREPLMTAGVARDELIMVAATDA